MIMIEEWRDIKKFEGIYQVSNLGRIKSLSRKIWNYTTKEKILKPYPCGSGYLEVNLRDNGRRTVKMVHRLVAETFLDNHIGLSQVNHLDENIKNNRADNLEWCTPKHNANYGTRNKRQYEAMVKNGTAMAPRRIRMFRLDGTPVCQFENPHEAERCTGISQSNIHQCCHRQHKTAGGYKWEYVNFKKPGER